MDKLKETKLIEEWEFHNRTAYETFVKEKIQDLETIANEIFGEFVNNVTEWEKDYLKDRKYSRFVAKVEAPPEDKLLKGHGRVVEKIFESWEKHDEWEKLPPEKKKGAKEPLKHDPKLFMNTLTDLIRFRIICNYLKDVNYMDRKILELCEYDKKINMKERTDHIEVPFPDRRVGHRAMQYVFAFSHGEETVLFEVQVMTQLQHAWDKKDHHLIYEYDRIGQGDTIPLHLKNRMAAMSELLYVADTVFDSLYEEISGGKE